MKTNKRICLLLVALLSLSGVLPAVATDYLHFHGNFAGGPPGFGFVAGYGLHRGSSVIFPYFENNIRPLHAIVGGRRVQSEDALTPTSMSSSSWGQVKQLLLVNSMEERADR